ncbi:nicotinamide riboside transporter PnuC [Telmatospirillum sp.]|uniref:nicotinamide riboside transporter PnuC n=1 Tax=Telmatospirillum sp. TaxID=2079197 RepID=UPI002851CD22|nr:nicotinamide riboside transporter PnuC [Telmatospirillum sp.]MDR3435587.1 nicotinamide riboside transporter PnuC [Telmatospirillum sp.]
MSPLEIAAVVVSILGVWLTVRRNFWCWPVSLLSVALYGRVFFLAKLYSDTILQGVFGAFAVYGWWVWRSGVCDDGRVRVETLTLKGRTAGLLAGVLGTLALGGIMARYTDAAVPWLDAGLTSFSLVAQFWAARKCLQSWWMWIAVDVVYTGLFLTRSLYLTAALYSVFIFLAILGSRDWSKVQRAWRPDEEVPDGLRPVQVEELD